MRSYAQHVVGAIELCARPGDTSTARAACAPLPEFASRRGLAFLKPDPAVPRGGKLTTNGSARRGVRFARVRIFAVALDVRRGNP